MFDGVLIDDVSAFEARMAGGLVALESSTRLIFNVLSTLELPQGDAVTNPVENVARSIESIGRELADEAQHAARRGMVVRAERFSDQAEECFACARALRELPPE